MLTELTELCHELRNWFDRERIDGTFEIRCGCITPTGNTRWNTAPELGMYVRIIGSWHNDGVHQIGDREMKNETFTGSVWLLAIPQPVLDLAEDIRMWKEKYESVDSGAMSPYTSESWGGYSYQKTAPGSSGGGSGGGSYGWRSAFKPRLNAWRKILP